MSRLAALLLVALTMSACNEQDPATKACLSDAGTYQDCGIACTVGKSDEACTKWESQTRKLCDERGKQACEELCEADDNAAACTKAKAM